MPNSASSQTAYDYLITLFTQSQDKAFITEVCVTHRKRAKEIANRIQIFSLFQQGLPQREIVERLGVGIANGVTRCKGIHSA